MSSFAFKKSGNTRFVKVENSVKVNEAEQTSKILQVFRETSSNDPDSLEPGELCFRIEVRLAWLSCMTLSVHDECPFTAGCR